MAHLHQYTPSLTALDPRGLSVRTVNYHRLTVQQPPEARIHQSMYGATGFLTRQWDPRLQALRVSNSDAQPNLRHLTSLSGHSVRSDSVDSGWRVTLFGTARQSLNTWDGRGSHQRFEYDNQSRLTAIHEQRSDDPNPRCTERFTYATARTGGDVHNLCGRLVRHDDPAGVVLYEGYALSGASTRQTRCFARFPDAVNWPQDVTQRSELLETRTYSTQWQYNAQGDLLELVDAHGNRQRYGYGIAGEQTQIELHMASGKHAVLMDQRTYNAAGQVTTERAGNGVLMVASYSEADGRLQHLTAHRPGLHRTPLQDLAYTYDRVGNVVSILDSAQPTTWTHNSRIQALNTYSYDTLYQLVKATGRESTRPTGGRLLPDVMLMGADHLRWRNYTRHYHYDAGANLLHMQHIPSSGQGYSQRMRVAPGSNRSQLMASAAQGEVFDPCGNLTMLVCGQGMDWNVRNQLQRVTLISRDNAGNDEEFYAYDGQAARALKRRASLAKGVMHLSEVRYLPGLELQWNHVTGEQLWVAAVQAGHTHVRALKWEHGLPDAVRDEQIRFSLSDHLGSGVLELDEQAALLSQEGFYPFGATAWWAAKSALEATFKTLRYGGKERDATGLYYYGMRYYAPWMLRWINPDPAGIVDGLNLYAMLLNNPMSHIDRQGLQAEGLSPERRVAFGFYIVVVALLGAAIGHLHNAPLLGAALGAMLMTSLLALALRGERLSQQPHSEEDLYVFTQAVTAKVLEFTQAQHLSATETVKMFNFVYSKLAPLHEEVGISLGAQTTSGGEIYGYVGPASAIGAIKGLVDTGRPPSRESRKMGVHSILLRSRHLPSVAAPTVQHAVTTPDVPAAGALSRLPTAKKSHAARRQPPVTARPAPVQAAPPISVDETAVASALQGPEGTSIALTISHVLEGRFRAVNWHQHADLLWSADIHGYQGSRRRGAYRLMFEHLGDRRYRIAGIRDPH